jgi:hypothetical protein
MVVWVTVCVDVILLLEAWKSRYIIDFEWIRPEDSEV